MLLLMPPQTALIFRRICRCAELNIELCSENLFKSLVEKRHIASPQCLGVKVIWHKQISGSVVKIKVNGLNSADPCIVGNVGNFRFTVIAYNFPCVFKGVH